MGVGKSSLPATAAPVKKPVPKKAAMDAVKEWRYRPYILNGEPVEVDTQITVNFTLSGG